MLIMVRYTDGTYDMIIDYRLDPLIKSGKVVEFWRSGGWARVGRDKIRVESREFKGEERRSSLDSDDNYRAT